MKKGNERETYRERERELYSRNVREMSGKCILSVKQRGVKMSKRGYIS